MLLLPFADIYPGRPRYQIGDLATPFDQPFSFVPPTVQLTIPPTSPISLSHQQKSGPFHDNEGIGLITTRQLLVYHDVGININLWFVDSHLLCQSGLDFRPPSLCNGCLLSDDNICNSLPSIASSSFIFHIFLTFTNRYLSEQLDASSLSQNGRTAKLRHQVGNFFKSKREALVTAPFFVRTSQDTTAPTVEWKKWI